MICTNTRQIRSALFGNRAIRNSEWDDWNRQKHVVYISGLWFCIENKTDIKLSYIIWLQEPFICCAEGTYGMLLNGNRRFVAISASLYEEIALYRSCVLRVPRYRRTVSFSALRYMEISFSEYHVIKGLTVFRRSFVRTVT